jgi:hypothetical protein
LGPSERAFVRGLVDYLGAPVCFVGDLDPLDLATYATLVADSAALNVSYDGISDSWLEACEADLARHAGQTLQRVCIPMDDAEREGWTALVGLGVDWPALAGPRAVSMLGSGVKLEVEAATNPTLYSSAFRAELTRLLFR